jgi:hypothetical protein
LQIGKLTADSDPAWEPGSPLPLLTLPLVVDRTHVSRVPVVVSLILTRPDVACTPPPGWTVQVLAASAAALMI